MHPAHNSDIFKLSSRTSRHVAILSRSVYNLELCDMVSADEQPAPFRLMDLPAELRFLIWECYVATLELKPHRFSDLSVLQQTAIRQMPPSHPLYWLKEPHLLQSCQTIRHEVIRIYLRRLKADREKSQSEIAHCNGPWDPTRYKTSSLQAYGRHCFRAQTTRLRLEIVRIGRELEAMVKKRED